MKYPHHLAYQQWLCTTRRQHPLQQRRNPQRVCIRKESRSTGLRFVICISCVIRVSWFNSVSLVNDWLNIIVNHGNFVLCDIGWLDDGFYILLQSNEKASVWLLLKDKEQEEMQYVLNDIQCLLSWHILKSKLLPHNSPDRSSNPWRPPRAGVSQRRSRWCRSATGRVVDKLI